MRFDVVETVDPILTPLHLVENPGIERATRTATEQLVSSLVERLVSCLLVWLVSWWIGSWRVFWYILWFWGLRELVLAGRFWGPKEEGEQFGCGFAEELLFVLGAWCCWVVRNLGTWVVMDWCWVVGAVCLDEPYWLTDSQWSLPGYPVTFFVDVL